MHCAHQVKADVIASDYVSQLQTMAPFSLLHIDPPYGLGRHKGANVDSCDVAWDEACWTKDQLVAVLEKAKMVMNEDEGWTAFIWTPFK